MLARTWHLLRPLITRPARRVVALGLASAVSGVLEAVVLVLAVNVALAVSNKATDQEIDLPLVGSAASTSTLIWVAAAMAVALFAVHALVAWLAADLSAEVLESTRGRAITAYLRASWPAQAQSREGALQESFSTLAVLSSSVCLAFALCLSSLLNLAALMATALVVDPAATAVVILFGSVVFAATRPVSRATRRLANGYVASNSELSEDVSRVASLAMEYRLFGVSSKLESDLLARGRSVAGDLRRTRTTSQFGSSMYRDVALFFLIGGLAAFTALGDANLSGIGTVVLIVLRGLGYATQLQGSIQNLSEYGPNLEALNDRLARLEDAAETDGTVETSELGAVVFTDVSYEYVQGVRAIRDVNLEIPEGETVGIIGPSGSGKSTLLQVLLRLRRPTAGSVTVAGKPYETISARSWARLVALVPQEPQLMQASVSDNIRFLRPGISQAEIERAADAAHVGDEIRALTDGFDTMLGPRGSGLSGGQKQRVAIARALVGRPRLLVLDEPTSALDMTSERRLQQTLEELKGTITIVIVAHRQGTLDTCDRLVALRSGTIESDTHPNAKTI